jgi:hypothetical protein
VGNLLAGNASAEKRGIKQSDWLGKYWARWGDALQESGFEPNQLQAALDEQILIEKFIELMRELRKFPTDSEVKLKARAAEGFRGITVLRVSAQSNNLPHVSKSTARNGRATRTSLLSALYMQSLGGSLQHVKMTSRKKTLGLFI